MDLVEQAISRITDRRAVIGILGLGYVGLPLACTFAEAGFHTIGFDVDQAKIEQLLGGKSYIGHIPSQRLAQLISAGTLDATSHFETLRKCDVSIICVPTPFD